MRTSDPTDKHVGGRVKMRRLMLGMSQEKVGAILGVTFQQVQKYEKGTNRISASRLHHIAHIFGVTESFFFEGRSPNSTMNPRNAAMPMYLDDFLASREGAMLAGAFMRIKNTKLRRSIVQLVICVADAVD